MEEKKSHLRRDAHHGGWVLLPDQPEREQLLALPKEKWPKGNDALCHPEKAGANIIHRLEARQADGKQHVVRVIANRFALYKVEGQEDREGRGMYDLMRNVGAHEIIIESESHQDTLCTMSPHHFALALHAMQDRIHDLRNDVRLKSFSIFREWQLANGDAKQHPHSQLIASAIIPLGLKNELDSAWEYYDYKERCLFCDMVRQEISDKERIVKESSDFITYCPFASRNAFEIHLFPKQHHAWFSELPHEKLTALAEMIRDTAYRLEEAIPGWRVMMAFHSAPAPDKRQKPHNRLSSYYHWHIEFLPIPPGFVDWYVRTGTHVECTPPENAAEYLRKIDVASPWG